MDHVTTDPAALRYVVTGAAGFIGSHLCEALLRRGHEVVGVDDLSSGRRCNLAGFMRQPTFSFREADINDGVPVRGHVDGLFHLIAPTPATSSIDAGTTRLPPLPTGVDQVVEFSTRRRCRLLLVGATGAEYEDPFEPDRSELPEQAARLGAQVRLARLFDAYGPRMEAEDEPTLMHLLLQASTGQPMVVPSDESSTISLCFVSDLVNGLLRLFRSDIGPVPVDLGDASEHPVHEVASLLRCLSGTDVPIETRPARATPRRTRADMHRTAELLGWAPRVPLSAGLRSTWVWLLGELGPTVGGAAAARRTA